MSALLRFTVVAFFLAGLITVGLLGTSTSLTFVWPGYLVIGLAGLTSIIALFRPNKFNIPFWCIGAVFLVAGYLLLRAMNSPVAYFAREDGVLMVSCFVIYMVFLSLIDSARWRKGLFWTFVALLAFNVGLAAIQLFKGGDFWVLSGYQRTFEDRIGGVFNHPEHFAAFMALGVVYLSSIALFGHHSKKLKALLTILSLLCFGAIIATKSLLGIFAVGAGLTCLAFVVTVIGWNKLSKGRRRLTAVGFSLAVLSFAVVLGLNHGKVTQGLLTRGGDVKLSAAWSAGVEQFAESPFAGTGSRTSHFYSRKYHPEGSELASEFESEFVHNEYIQALADYGLVGLFLIVGLVLLHLYNGFRFVKGYSKFQTANGKILPKSNHLGYVVAAFAGVTTLGFLAFFDFVMHIPALAMFASVFLGYLACPDPMSHALHTEAEDRPFIPGGSLLFAGRSVAFGAGVGLVIFGCVFGRSEWHMEMARLKFESNEIDSVQREHLVKARSYDRKNPFLMSLSAHSYVRAINSEMSVTERIAYLEKAEGFFQKAEALYPQDVHRAVAHSVVLEALGRTEDAGEKLVKAREWAPLNSNIMVAQAEHFLRREEYGKAERSFRMAQNIGIYPDADAIDRGLAAVARWKGIDSGDSIASVPEEEVPAVVESLMKTGDVKELEISGAIGSAIDDSLELIENKLDGKIVDPVVPQDAPDQ